MVYKQSKKKILKSIWNRKKEKERWRLVFFIFIMYKNLDLEYIKEVMRIMFNKDLEEDVDLSD